MEYFLVRYRVIINDFPRESRESGYRLVKAKDQFSAANCLESILEDEYFDYDNVEIHTEGFETLDTGES